MAITIVSPSKQPSNDEHSTRQPSHVARTSAAYTPAAVLFARQDYGPLIETLAARDQLSAPQARPLVRQACVASHLLIPAAMYVVIRHLLPRIASTSSIPGGAA